MNPNTAKQNFIASLTKPKTNTPMDVFGTIKKTAKANVPGTPAGYKPLVSNPVLKPAPKPPAEPKPMSVKPKFEMPKPTPKYPFKGTSPISMNPASSVPNTAKQGFMDKIMGQFGGNKIGNSIATHPATSWIYGNNKQQPSTTVSNDGNKGIDLTNPFATKTAEASGGETPTQTPQNDSMSGDEWGVDKAFGITTPTAPTGQNGASTGNEYTDFLRSYNKGMTNIENQVIPLEDITGEQANMQRVYGDELQARATMAGLNKDGSTELLSVTEAQSLGVPYGTTKAQAYGMNVAGKPTDANNTSALYANRVKEAEDIFTQTFPEISKMGTAELAAARLAAQSGGSIGNALLSPVLQQQFQAERNFINAMLRRESGAAISESEFANARKQYFPQAGDSAQVLEQKRQNRQTALNGLIQASGPAYTKNSSGSVPTNQGNNQDVGIGLF